MAPRTNCPGFDRATEPLKLVRNDAAERSADASDANDGDAARLRFARETCCRAPVQLGVERIKSESFRDRGLDLAGKVQPFPFATPQRLQDWQIGIVFRA